MNFAFVPPQYNTIFVSSVNMVWQTFLSWSPRGNLASQAVDVFLSRLSRPFRPGGGPDVQALAESVHPRKKHKIIVQRLARCGMRRSFAEIHRNSQSSSDGGTKGTEGLKQTAALLLLLALPLSISSITLTIV